MTKIIGLTGGIGSGKTTIAKYIESKGIPIYIADDEARKIIELPEISSAIKSSFGETVFDKGKLNREQLAAIVFGNPEKLKQLNKIVHPAVKIHFENWLKKHKKSDFIVKEAAILFESGGDKDCFAIITVVAPLEVRIERVVKRDKSDIENIRKRINNQWTDAMRIEKSDYVIQNSNIDNAKSQIDEVLEIISKKSLE
ncbi:MAG: dephospho-CoA kinase [Bacteroidota bacterium]